jgi:hypothetical protein
MSRQAYDAFVLATADEKMQDRWIPKEEWVHHIRSREYFKPCKKVKSLNFGISTQFQFFNDRYECPFAKQVLYLMHKHHVTVMTKKIGEKEAEKKNIFYFIFIYQIETMQSLRYQTR